MTAAAVLNVSDILLFHTYVFVFLNISIFALFSLLF